MRNPHYFVRPEADVSLVVIEGDYPVIAEAYQKLGVPVEAFRDQVSSETVPVDQSDAKNLDGMTVDELQVHLNELGVEFDSKAKKADLLKLAKEQ